ncbi:hypothetical protein, partial [Pseudomonas sp. SIMBA_021]
GPDAKALLEQRKRQQIYLQHTARYSRAEVLDLATTNVLAGKKGHPRALAFLDPKGKTDVSLFLLGRYVDALDKCTLRSADGRHEPLQDP